jgi:APA family basic amino acid/polyamine antiporter
MFAVSRIIAAVARTHLLPPFLAKVSNRWGTPWIATLLQGIATALIALFTGRPARSTVAKTKASALASCSLGQRYGSSVRTFPASCIVFRADLSTAHHILGHCSITSAQSPVLNSVVPPSTLAPIQPPPTRSDAPPACC